MTQEYRIWKPEHDGHAPPNWREGMKWGTLQNLRDFDGIGTACWDMGRTYYVSPEALNSPNDDAANYEKSPDLTFGDVPLEALVTILRHYPAEELAKHGITLAPEKDWATELWADLLEDWRFPVQASHVRNGKIGDQSRIAIERIRARFEQMKGDG